MNGVDIGDQLRANIAGNHHQRRSPARTLTWGFFLSVALSNSFLLQHLGQPQWKPYKAKSRFLEALTDEIFETYNKTGTTRKRYRAGDEFTPLSQHKNVNRGKKTCCLGCQGIQMGPRARVTKKQRVLQQLDENTLNSRPQPSQTAPKTNLGCDVCDVAICNSPKCWYFYHEQSY